VKTLDELLAEKHDDVNCLYCQGHSLPGVKAGEPGHCPVCNGRAYVTKSTYELLTDKERVDVLEAEVMRLRPDLKVRYGKST
jgi:hypothetical protein